MAELHERVAHLETGMDDQKQLNADLRADLKDLRVEMRSEFANVRGEMRSEFASVRAEILASRTEMAVRSETTAEFGRVWAEIRDLRSTMARGFERVDQKFDVLHQKIDKQFVWLIGVMLTGFLFLFGAILQVLVRLP
jgi:hypothetical protein